MTTFWDTTPSDNELELWWLTQVEQLSLPTAAGKAGIEAERAAETVERVEAFLLEAKRGADERENRREPGERTLAAAVAIERVEELLGLAAQGILHSLREQRTVRVHETDGVIEKIVITLEPGRPKRDLLRTLKQILKLRRERLETCDEAFRRPGRRSAERSEAPVTLRIAGPDQG